MSTPEIDKLTISEWRGLGFFYERDDAQRTWRIRANRKGIAAFCGILRAYARDVDNEPVSQHEHLGPYGYLKLVTWPTPEIRLDGIYGGRPDFERLAAIVEKATQGLREPSSVVLNGEYAENNEARLEIVLENIDFDPARADPALDHAQGA